MCLNVMGWKIHRYPADRIGVTAVFQCGPHPVPGFLHRRSGQALSSMTCLAGDVIGDYSFDHEIHVGDRLVFEDMAIYSMVKNNTFNGIGLPDICLLHEDGAIETVKRFGYEDFKNRLS